MTAPGLQLKSVRSRVRHDILYRLRWDVFGPLENIEIAAGPLGQEAFVPFFGSSYAHESIAQPPFGRLEVNIADLGSKHDFDYSEEVFRYQPPPPLIIQNDKDTPITMGQFVTQAHEYFKTHKEETIEEKCVMCESIARDKGASVRFFFWKMWTFGNDEFCRVNINTVGNVQRFYDGFWERQLRDARTAELERQDHGPASGSVSA